MRQERVRREPKAELKKLKAMMADEVRFFRTWIGKPLTTGAVSPSGRFLARAMAERVDPSVPGVVVELGPGTGAVTAALLERGVPKDRLLAIEYNPDFVRMLSARYPGVRAVRGDAYDLCGVLAEEGVTQVAAVVSSLPLFTRPPRERRRLLEDAMDLMRPGGRFIQFSYALVPPVCESHGPWSLDVSDWILRNLPPARVWTYSRRADA